MPHMMGGPLGNLFLRARQYNPGFRSAALDALWTASHGADRPPPKVPSTEPFEAEVGGDDSDLEDSLPGGQARRGRASRESGEKMREQTWWTSQVEEADSIFAIIDTDHSGTIEPNELLLHLLDQGQEPETIAELFRGLDTDGDGVITKEEWRAGYARFRSLMSGGSEGEDAKLAWALPSPPSRRPPRAARKPQSQPQDSAVSAPLLRTTPREETAGDASPKATPRRTPRRRAAVPGATLEELHHNYTPALADHASSEDSNDEGDVFDEPTDLADPVEPIENANQLRTVDSTTTAGHTVSAANRKAFGLPSGAARKKAPAPGRNVRAEELPKEVFADLQARQLEVEMLLRLSLSSGEELDAAANRVTEALQFDEELAELAASRGILKGKLFQALVEALRKQREAEALIAAVVAPDDSEGETPRPLDLQQGVPLTGNDEFNFTRDEWAELVRRADDLRQLIKIKVQDDNDLRTAHSGLDMCKDFLGTLSKSAKQVGDGATAFDVYKTLL